MKKSAGTDLKSGKYLFIVAVLFVWEMFCRASQVPEYILPSPLAVAGSLLGKLPLLASHTVTTMSAVISGLAIALIIALPLSVAMNRWIFFKKLFYPVLVISQAVPIFALAPLLMIWFGVGLLPKILIVALVCFFPLAVNFIEGLEQVDPEVIDLMKTMKASRIIVFKTVQLPSSLPYLFSGLKIAATYSVLGAIIGEWLGAKSGLGIFMLRAKNSFHTSDVFAAIFIVIVLSLALFKLVELAAWLLMPWNRDEIYESEVD